MPGPADDWPCPGWGLSSPSLAEREDWALADPLTESLHPGRDLFHRRMPGGTHGRSLSHQSDISALGRAPYPPNTGLGPEKALHTLVTSLKCVSTLVLDP